MRTLLLIPFVALAAAGCRSGVVCTLEARAGVNVNLADEDGDPISGAVLTLSEGDYSEIMQGGFDAGGYAGAFERAGTYTLTVEADRFETAVVEDILVAAGVCHVEAVTLDVTLSAT